MSQLAREVINNFRYQTICVGVILRIINSQITKAHNYLYNNYISISLFNSFSTLYIYIGGQHKKNSIFSHSLIAIKSVK